MEAVLVTAFRTNMKFLSYCYLLRFLIIHNISLSYSLIDIYIINNYYYAYVNCELSYTFSAKSRNRNMQEYSRLKNKLT